jgi:hypothetical protein
VEDTGFGDGRVKPDHDEGSAVLKIVGGFIATEAPAH